LPKISRRKLIVGATAARLALGSVKTAPAKEMPPRAAKADPIIPKVRAWMAEHDARDAMMREWQDLEVALCDRIKRTPLGLTEATRSGLPEARAMRKLGRRIKASGKRLDRAAGRIILSRAISAEGALAKIEMGMKLQGPYDWEEYAYALVLGGIGQLQDLSRDAR
jgi:hypothetical protein